MAAFKGADWLRATTANDASSEESEEDVPNPTPQPDLLNKRLSVDFSQWQRAYQGELEYMYHNYRI